MTRSRLRALWNKHFEEQENFEFLSPALSELIKLEVIDEFDIEFSGVLDDASGSHSEHGDIDLFDVDGYSGLDELLHHPPVPLLLLWSMWTI